MDIKNLYCLEKMGWSYSLGWNPNYGGYFAQAYRSYKNGPIYIKSTKVYMECYTCPGQDIDEAISNLLVRIGQLEKLKE